MSARALLSALALAALAAGLLVAGTGCSDSKTLTMRIEGGGGIGTVSGGKWAAWDCPRGPDQRTTCSTGYVNGTLAQLRAEPFAGYRFTGWAGACSGTKDCSVSMTADATVTARFARGAAPPDATLRLAVSGRGEIMVAPEYERCGAACALELPAGSHQVLTAQADANAQFVGWDGACAEPPNTSSWATCWLTLDGDTSAKAVFTGTPGCVALELGVVPPGGGSVRGEPAPGSPANTCGAWHAPGTRVLLRTAAAPGWAFQRWDGAPGCGNAPTCTVRFGTTDIRVTAVYGQAPSLLTVVPSPNGSGAVVSADGAIQCPNQCQRAYPGGTKVTLEARPSTGWSITGWSVPGCGTERTCTATVAGETTVTVTFAGATPPTTTGGGTYPYPP